MVVYAYNNQLLFSRFLIHHPSIMFDIIVDELCEIWRCCTEKSLTWVGVQYNDYPWIGVQGGTQYDCCTEKSLTWVGVQYNDYPWIGVQGGTQYDYKVTLA